MSVLFERLSEKHLSWTDAFHCGETEEQLAKYTSSVRRRIKKHSKEMDDFLKNEAFSEQELGTSTTYLLIDDVEKRILAYVSLCSDAIRLEVEEREEAGITYSSAPALKIARLAVSTNDAGQGRGKFLIEFAASEALAIRAHAGVFFLTLDCYEHRESFYEKIGFKRNLIQPVILPFDSPISMRIGLDEYLKRITE